MRTAEIQPWDEIEAPPDPKTSKEMPLFLVIGPSMTMMIPMASGSILAIMAAMSSNGSPSITMFTGILVAVLSAIIGSVVGLIILFIKPASLGVVAMIAAAVVSIVSSVIQEKIM